MKGAGQLPLPHRITLALDWAQQYGPEVDAALGVQEPTVDMWESGKAVPTWSQIVRLGLLTGFPPDFFYKPFAAPLDPSRLHVCSVSLTG